MLLCADIGGTNSRFALWEPQSRALSKEWRFSNGDFRDFARLLQELKQSLADGEVKTAAIAVAGPLQDRTKAELTNIDWKIEVSEVRETLDLDSVTILNDLEATAHGIDRLKKEDLLQLHRPSRKVPGNRAVISPGTGLGEAGLFFDGSQYHPFATEGGHADFAPRTEEEIRLLQHLLARHPNASFEDIVSGMGLVKIYEFLETQSDYRQEAEAIRAERQPDDLAKTITQRAVEENCPICLQTVRIFIHGLASEAASLALKLKATGGVYIGGGIPLKILPLLQKPWFLERFLSNEKMKPLLKTMPVSVILTDTINLLGAAAFAERSRL